MYARFITIYTNLLLSITEAKDDRLFLEKTIFVAGRSSIVSMMCVYVCVCRRFSKRCCSIAKIMIETGNGVFSCSLHCNEFCEWIGKLMVLFCSFMKYTNLYTQIKENKCNYSANSKLNYMYIYYIYIIRRRTYSFFAFIFIKNCQGIWQRAHCTHIGDKLNKMFKC